MENSERRLGGVFPASRKALGNDWQAVAADCGDDPQTLPEVVRSRADVPPFAAELAELERALWWAQEDDVAVARWSETYDLNPTLQVLHLNWRLTALVDDPGASPEPGEQWVLVWRDVRTGETRARPAKNEELLAVKMVADGVSPDEAAQLGGLPPQAVDGVLRAAAEDGILIGPPSRIRRDPEIAVGDDEKDAARAFTLQWHITQACDLHCKHCYDRSRRSPMTAEQGLKVLDDVVALCRNKNVRGHVSFTGGNPFMYPHFEQLYQAASDRWFTTSILGNPTPRERVKALVEIQMPRYFQVSLEGLREHNDDIRGTGHFDRTMEFLDLLRELNVPSGVMLTLTADNVEQVLPLADILRDKADSFTFNRLSPVGEGADLALPSRRDYERFLEAYVRAADDNPILGFKDNLINIVLHRHGRGTFGGCTGHGCGAAFNFLAVLPDGQVHACRKFPSLVGNVFEQALEDIYDSEASARYRRGSLACDGCDLRAVCGGCLAVADGLGRDAFAELDPHCFLRSDG